MLEAQGASIELIDLKKNRASKRKKGRGGKVDEEDDDDDDDDVFGEKEFLTDQAGAKPLPCSKATSLFPWIAAMHYLPAGRDMAARTGPRISRWVRARYRPGGRQQWTANDAPS